MKRGTALTLALLLTLSLSAVVVLIVRAGPAEPKFCSAGWAFAEIDGQTYGLQDQGGSGPDGCDMSDGTPGYVDFDCDVHGYGSGRVIGRLDPNRADGTCGQRDRQGGRWAKGPMHPA